MRRKIFGFLLVSIFLAGLFANNYLEIEYNTTLWDTLTSRSTLSRDEVNFLNEHGPLIYGADNNAPPLRYVDPDTGQYTGLVVDYMAALSIELGTEILFTPLVWTEALAKLEKGDTDLCDMFPSKNRGKKYIFSAPIYNLRGIILTRSDNFATQALTDLEGKRVATPNGDFAVDFIREESKNVTLVTTPNMFEALKLLEMGDVDAVIGDEPVIAWIIEHRQNRSNFRFVETPLYENDCVLALPKDQEKLLAIVNKGILSLRRKQILEKVQQKWLGISAPFAKEKSSEKMALVIKIFLTATAMLLYLFTSWNSLLKREVEKRTRELASSQNDLQTTFDGLTFFMIVVDQSRTIANVNLAFCQFMKTSKEALCGRAVSEFPGVLHFAPEHSPLEATFASGKARTSEFIFERKTFEIRLFPLEFMKDTPDKILVMIKDITMEREGEKKLLYANKMAAIGQMAAGVTHEIRNPLGLIRNHCYVLKNIAGVGTPAVQKSVAAIEGAVAQTSGYIDNLLNFSRISGDTVAEVDIHRLARRMVRLNRKRIEKRHIETQIICDAPLVCRINEESLGHILINLISNAVDAMEGGGTLTLNIKKRVERIEILIKDTGHGIDKETLNNIFDPFFTTKPRGKGTGLGLYITYNEVQKNRGEIRVESLPGKGTTFHVTIPTVYRTVKTEDQMSP